MKASDSCGKGDKSHTSNTFTHPSRDTGTLGLHLGWMSGFLLRHVVSLRLNQSIPRTLQRPPQEEQTQRPTVGALQITTTALKHCTLLTTLLVCRVNPKLAFPSRGQLAPLPAKRTPRTFENPWNLGHQEVHVNPMNDHVFNRGNNSPRDASQTKPLHAITCWPRRPPA